MGRKLSALGLKTGTVLSAVLLLASFGSLQLACKNQVGGSAAPQIVVEPDSTMLFPQLPPDQKTAQPVTITNLGDASLVIKSIVMDKDGPAWDLLDYGCQDGCVKGSFQLTPGKSFTFRVSYWQHDEKNHTATLRINSNDPLKPVWTIQIASSKPRPQLDISPNPVEFKTRTDPGQTSEIDVLMKNVGTADLAVYKLARQGDSAFTLLHPVGAPFTDTADDGVHPLDAVGQGQSAPAPLMILKAGDVYQLRVRFTPTNVGEATGKLVIYTNDESLPDKKKVVQIIANSKGPCLLVKDDPIDFGYTLIGQTDSRTVILESCGKEPIQVSDVQLDPNSSKDFKLDPINAGDLNKNLNQGDAIIVTVRYTPGEKGSDDGKLIVTTNREDSPTVEVKIEGNGTDKLCPVAKIEVKEGLAVLPQTTLHLRGDGSTGSDGNTSTVVQWQWEVEAPNGSFQSFVPSPSVPNPSFTANVAGLYTFRLRVWDNQGQESCEPAEVKVNVNPINAIHVELTWKTPGDPDEFDDGPDAGTDLDLHFKHEQATGWFDFQYDVFWYNPSPNWGLYNDNADDNPSLDLDDSDGAGPENLNMNGPEEVTYTVGVHYWRDPAKFGNVQATVRVFIYGVLVLETKPTELTKFDFWEVATIEWNNDKDLIKVNLLTNNDGSAKIEHNYVAPINLDALSN